MNKSVATLLSILLAWSVVAQERKQNSTEKSKPTFEGSWTLSFTKDNSQKKIAAIEPVVLSVRQQESELSFVESAGSNLRVTYYTDGRGEENLFTLNINTKGQKSGQAQVTEKLMSITKWKGEKLVTLAHLSTVVNGKRFVVEIVKEWKLSKDGSTLTITTRMTNPDPNPNGNMSGGKTGGWGASTVSRTTSANPNSSIAGQASIGGALVIPFVSVTDEVYSLDRSGKK